MIRLNGDASHRTLLKEERFAVHIIQVFTNLSFFPENFHIVRTFGDIRRGRLFKNLLSTDNKVLNHFLSVSTREPVIDLLKENNIFLVRVPPNMTHLYQPLDLTR